MSRRDVTMCVECKQNYFPDGFSRTQRSHGEARRCRNCVAHSRSRLSRQEHLLRHQENLKEIERKRRQEEEERQKQQEEARKRLEEAERRKRQEEQHKRLCDCCKSGPRTAVPRHARSIPAIHLWRAPSVASGLTIASLSTRLPRSATTAATVCPVSCSATVHSIMSTISPPTKSSITTGAAQLSDLDWRALVGRPPIVRRHARRLSSPHRTRVRPQSCRQL
jgi:hypothetical protein